MGYPEEGPSNEFGTINWDVNGDAYVVVDGVRRYDLVVEKKTSESGWTTYEGNCCPLCGSITCRGGCFK